MSDPLDAEIHAAQNELTVAELVFARATAQRDNAVARLEAAKVAWYLARYGQKS